MIQIYSTLILLASLWLGAEFLWSLVKKPEVIECTTDLSCASLNPTIDGDL